LRPFQILRPEQVGSYDDQRFAVFLSVASELGRLDPSAEVARHQGKSVAGCNAPAKQTEAAPHKSRHRNLASQPKQLRCSRTTALQGRLLLFCWAENTSNAGAVPPLFHQRRSAQTRNLTNRPQKSNGDRFVVRQQCRASARDRWLNPPHGWVGIRTAASPWQSGKGSQSKFAKTGRYIYSASSWRWDGTAFDICSSVFKAL